MQYVHCSPPCDATGLHCVEGDLPILQSGQVLIRVCYAGVNRPDILQRGGKYPPPKGASPILGLEVSGTIAALSNDIPSGSTAKKMKQGDRVCALTNGGGYAEYVAVDAGHCIKLDDSVSLLEAAALPEALFTLWSNIFSRAPLASGKTFLLHGASGGIGSTAVQIANALGWEVFATAGSTSKQAFCLSLGARRVWLYKQDDWEAELQALLGKRGLDFILDSVGGEYIQKHINLAAYDAKIVNIAFQKGAHVKLNLMRLMLKRIMLTGSTLRSRSSEYKTELCSQLTSHLWPLVVTRQVVPQIFRVFTLDQAAQAHQLLESGEVEGKLVLALPAGGDSN